MAQAAGRDPATIGLAHVVLWPVKWEAEAATSGGRRTLTGSSDEMRQDVDTLARAGVRHLCLSFHAQWKLRTVMWDFVGDPLPPELLADLRRFVREGPPVELTCLLDRFENDALLGRARALVRAGVFPDDDTGGHRYPWPLV